MKDTISKKTSHLKSGNKIMLLNYKEFQSHFSENLQQHTQVDDLFTHRAFFTQGIRDSVALIIKMYESGRLDLTYRNLEGLGINTLGEYENECQLSEESDLDELIHPLLSRYYYSGVRQIFECINRDFKVSFRR